MSSDYKYLVFSDRPTKLAGGRGFLSVRSIFRTVFQQEQADNGRSGILSLKQVRAPPGLNGLRTSILRMETKMASKLSAPIIAATVAASMAITPAAQAGSRGLGHWPRHSGRRRHGSSGPAGAQGLRRPGLAPVLAPRLRLRPAPVRRQPPPLAASRKSQLRRPPPPRPSRLRTPLSRTRMRPPTTTPQEGRKHLRRRALQHRSSDPGRHLRPFGRLDHRAAKTETATENVATAEVPGFHSDAGSEAEVKAEEPARRPARSMFRLSELRSRSAANLQPQFSSSNVRRAPSGPGAFFAGSRCPREAVRIIFPCPTRNSVEGGNFGTLRHEPRKIVLDNGLKTALRRSEKRRAQMTPKFIAIATVIAAAVTFSATAADAGGGVRLNFGVPLGNFTATPARGGGADLSNVYEQKAAARKAAAAREAELRAAAARRRRVSPRLRRPSRPRRLRRTRNRPKPPQRRLRSRPAPRRRAAAPL